MTPIPDSELRTVLAIQARRLEWLEAGIAAMTVLARTDRATDIMNAVFQAADSVHAENGTVLGFIGEPLAEQRPACKLLEELCEFDATSGGHHVNVLRRYVKRWLAKETPL